MEGLVDLHTHTTASDGSMEPAELIYYAVKKGVKIISITDHDTIDGLDEAFEEAKKHEIIFIPGIEISVEYKIEMHILGYFDINNYKNIKIILGELVNSRNKRNVNIINALNGLGMKISYEDVEREAKGNIVGRPHIAQIMLDMGYVKSREEAFEKYIGNTGKAYYPKTRLTPEEGIKSIIKAGGVSLLAHPVHLKMEINELDKELKNLVSYGLYGMEVYYVDNKVDDTGNFIRLAKKHKLLMSGGSDFHGKYKNNIEIGIGRGNLNVPYKCYEDLKTAIDNKVKNKDY